MATIEEKIKRVTRFVTTDNSEFDTMPEARIHQEYVDRKTHLLSVLESSDIYWRGDVDTDDVAELLLQNFILTPRGV